MRIVHAHWDQLEISSNPNNRSRVPGTRHQHPVKWRLCKNQRQKCAEIVSWSGAGNTWRRSLVACFRGNSLRRQWTASSGPWLIWSVWQYFPSNQLFFDIEGIYLKRKRHRVKGSSNNRILQILCIRQDKTGQPSNLFRICELCMRIEINSRYPAIPITDQGCQGRAISIRWSEDFVKTKGRSARKSSPGAGPAIRGGVLLLLVSGAIP